MQQYPLKQKVKSTPHIWLKISTLECRTVSRNRRRAAAGLNFSLLKALCVTAGAENTDNLYEGYSDPNSSDHGHVPFYPLLEPFAAPVDIDSLVSNDWFHRGQTPGAIGFRQPATRSGDVLADSEVGHVQPIPIVSSSAALELLLHVVPGQSDPLRIGLVVVPHPGPCLHLHNFLDVLAKDVGGDSGCQFQDKYHTKEHCERHGHAVVLPDSTTAPEESQHCHDAPDDDQENGGGEEGVAEEVDVGGVLDLNDRTCHYDGDTREPKDEVKQE